MALDRESSELNLSKRGGGFPYWQEQLKVLWTEIKRSSVYEYETQNLQSGNDTTKMGRKPGGRNQK